LNVPVHLSPQSNSGFAQEGKHVHIFTVCGRHRDGPLANDI
jgi:hypothetical protein